MTPQLAMKAAQSCATLAKTELECMDWGEIAEPGYDNDKPAFFANWNTQNPRQADGHYRSPNHKGELPDDPTMERLGNILERMGCELEWSDEWTRCDDCGKFVRISPDCWDWKQYGAMIGECSLVCGDCIQEDPDEYLAERINNSDNAVNTDFVNLAEQGFKRLDQTYESGFHPGQNDDPAKVLESLQESNPEAEYVFTYEPSQFYVSFQVWKREGEEK